MKKRPFLHIVSLMTIVSVFGGSHVEIGLSSGANKINNDTLEKRVLAQDNKMIYPIYVYGSAVLREPAIEITRDYANLGELLSNMFATMSASNGVGLAAPQIGKSIRIFTIDVPVAVEDGESPERLVKVFINPTIYACSEASCSVAEGCLSLPGLSGDVVRPISIKMRYCDEHFNEYDEVFTGFTARVIQHEYDHLEGVVYTDRLSPEDKVLLEEDLASMIRGEFSAEYETEQTTR